MEEAVGGMRQVSFVDAVMTVNPFLSAGMPERFRLPTGSRRGQPCFRCGLMGHVQRICWTPVARGGPHEVRQGRDCLDSSSPPPSLVQDRVRWLRRSVQVTMVKGVADVETVKMLLSKRGRMEEGWMVSRVTRKEFLAVGTSEVSEKLVQGGSVMADAVVLRTAS